MAPRDPYRMLAPQLEGSFRTDVKPTQRVPLYLTPEEWDLVIKALHNAAAPYAPRNKKAASAGKLGGGADAS